MLVDQEMRAHDTLSATDTPADELVLALADVTDASAACATHGDLAALSVLRRWHALLGETAAAGGARVLRTLGDGAVVAFPVRRARDAVNAMRVAQARGTLLWRDFDARCRVHVRLDVGRVVCARLGPPGDERLDVYGDPLDRLFRAPSAEFVVGAVLKALLGEPR